MGLKDILKQHNIPIPIDFDERLDVIISGLKKKPDFHDKLRKFKQTRGGAEPEAVAPPIVPDSEDYLGPRLRWFLKAVTSPYARTMLEGIFMVVFFLSYLERIPIFGSILSASLDVILAGGKILVKSVQSILPAAIGMIPLPYTAMVGIAMAALFGFIGTETLRQWTLGKFNTVAANLKRENTSDDGTFDDSSVAMAFQGLTPTNASPCLLELRVMGVGLCNDLATFTRLLTHILH
jgi:hypothetical protein